MMLKCFYILILINIAVFKLCLCQRRTTEVLQKDISSEKKYLVYFVKSTHLKTDNESWMCTGALVSPTQILTAAACLMKIENIYAVAGYKKYVSSRELSNDMCTNITRRRVIKISIPKEYTIHSSADKSLKSVNVDIGVATVDNPYILSDQSNLKHCSYAPQPIQINFDKSYELETTIAITLVWGLNKTLSGSPQQTELPHEATAVIVNLTSCASLATSDDAKPLVDKYLLCTSDVESRIEATHIKENSTNYNVTDEQEIYTNDTEKSNIPNSRTSSLSLVSCQNNHGAPLVRWIGSHEMAIGVALNNSYELRHFVSTAQTAIIIKCLLETNATALKLCNDQIDDKQYEVNLIEIKWPENVNDRTLLQLNRRDNANKPLQSRPTKDLRSQVKSKKKQQTENGQDQMQHFQRSQPFYQLEDNMQPQSNGQYQLQKQDSNQQQQPYGQAYYEQPHEESNIQSYKQPKEEFYRQPQDVQDVPYIQPQIDLYNQPQQSFDQPQMGTYNQPTADSYLQPQKPSYNPPDIYPQPQVPQEVYNQPQMETYIQPQAEIYPQPQVDLNNRPQVELYNQPETESQYQAPMQPFNQPQADLYNPLRMGTPCPPQVDSYNQPQKESYNQPQMGTCNEPQAESHNQPPMESQNRPQAELYNQSPMESQNQPQVPSYNQSPMESQNQPEAESDNTAQLDMYNQAQIDLHIKPQVESYVQPLSETHKRPQGKIYNQPQGQTSNQAPQQIYNQPQSVPLNQPQTESFNEQEKEPYNQQQAESFNKPQRNQFSLPQINSQKQLGIKPYNEPAATESFDLDKGLMQEKEQSHEQPKIESYNKPQTQSNSNPSKETTAPSESSFNPLDILMSQEKPDGDSFEYAAPYKPPPVEPHSQPVSASNMPQPFKPAPVEPYEQPLSQEINLPDLQNTLKPLVQKPIEPFAPQQEQLSDQQDLEPTDQQHNIQPSDQGQLHPFDQQQVKPLNQQNVQALNPIQSPAQTYNRSQEQKALHDFPESMIDIPKPDLQLFEQMHTEAIEPPVPSAQDETFDDLYRHLHEETIDSGQEKIVTLDQDFEVQFEQPFDETTKLSPNDKQFDDHFDQNTKMKQNLKKEDNDVKIRPQVPLYDSNKK